MLKYVISSALVALLACSGASAAEKIKMNFNNEELTKVLEAYSKGTGQKFVIDPGVRGRISIFNQSPVDSAEAFNQLSLALATNGFAISKQDDIMVVKSARNIQRDLIEVSTQLPAIKPQRMYTWIVTLKNIPVEHLNRDLRILPSKDGEMNVNIGTNQFIITDWVTNLNRIAEIIQTIDQPMDAQTKQRIEAVRKERPLRGKGPLPKAPPAGEAAPKEHKE